MGVSPGAIDGVYDARTEAAVAAFYLRRGWDPFGPTELQLDALRTAEAAAAATARDARLQAAGNASDRPPCRAPLGGDAGADRRQQRARRGRDGAPARVRRAGQGRLGRGRAASQRGRGRCGRPTASATSRWPTPTSPPSRPRWRRRPRRRAWPTPARVALPPEATLSRAPGGRCGRQPGRRGGRPGAGRAQRGARPRPTPSAISGGADVQKARNDGAKLAGDARVARAELRRARQRCASPGARRGWRPTRRRVINRPPDTSSLEAITASAAREEQPHRGRGRPPGARGGRPGAGQRGRVLLEPAAAGRRGEGPAREHRVGTRDDRDELAPGDRLVAVGLRPQARPRRRRRDDRGAGPRHHRPRPRHPAWPARREPTASTRTASTWPSCRPRACPRWSARR